MALSHCGSSCSLPMACPTREVASKSPSISLKAVIHTEENNIQKKHSNKNFGRQRNDKNINHSNGNKSHTCAQLDRYLGKNLRRVCGKSKSENSKPDDPFKQIRTPGKKTDPGKTEIAKPNEGPALF